MKKFALILLVLSLARVGVAFADTTTASSSAVTGIETGVLTGDQLLYWVKGEPGQDGLNGVDGATGETGAQGIQGSDGTSVSTTAFTGSGGPCTTGGLKVDAATGTSYICNGTSGSSVSSVIFTGVRGACLNGGVEFTDGLGNKSLACNGTNGANGATGATGATGANGTGGGGGGTIGYGQGEVSVTGCEADNVIIVNFTRQFTGSEFVFNAFTIGNPTVTNGDIKDTCATKTVAFYLKVKASGLVNTSGHYIANDVIKCSYTLPAAAGWPTGNPQFTLNASTAGFACATVRAPGTAVAIGEIYTADYTDKIGFEIG